jgi:hypothetical protein
MNLKNDLESAGFNSEHANFRASESILGNNQRRVNIACVISLYSKEITIQLDIRIGNVCYLYLISLTGVQKLPVREDYDLVRVYYLTISVLSGKSLRIWHKGAVRVKVE